MPSSSNGWAFGLAARVVTNCSANCTKFLHINLPQNLACADAAAGLSLCRAAGVCLGHDSLGRTTLLDWRVDLIARLYGVHTLRRNEVGIAPHALDDLEGHAPTSLDPAPSQPTVNLAWS